MHKQRIFAWTHWLELADDTVQRTLRRLPADLRARAEPVLIRYEKVVRPDLLAEGIEPDTMGLFEGCAFADELHSDDALPPRIIFFLENIRDEAEGDEAIFKEEVRLTYLHELGHFLGLNEDELAERDLD